LTLQPVTTLENAAALIFPARLGRRRCLRPPKAQKVHLAQLLDRKQDFNQWTPSPAIIEKIDPFSEYLKMISSKGDKIIARHFIFEN
jgi:hypothetical protein